MLSSRPSLTLATYNIHGGVGSDGRFDPDRILRVMQEVDADLWALQEVEHHLVGKLDLLDYLAQALGMQSIAGPTLLLRRIRHYGNAVVTRLPVRAIARIDLSHLGREPRGALDLRLDCSGFAGRTCELRVIATHLGLSPRERRAQIRQLLALLQADAGDPAPLHLAALMGDLNEWFLWGRILRWLHARFGDAPKLATFPAFLPLLALDHIWLSPRAALQRLEVHRSESARQASDHLPLKAIVRLGGEDCW